MLIERVIKKEFDGRYDMRVGPINLLMTFEFKELLQISEIYRC